MRVFRAIARGLAPLTLAGALIAYWHPPSFLIFEPVYLWLFAATMFALGVVLEPRELRDTLRHPGRIGLGVLTQYSVMPLLGLGAALVAPFSPELALGFVIVACAPGAMASNVICYLAGGALAYSIALTTLATLVSPLATPALVKLLGGVFLDISVWPMMKTILLTVLVPLLAGMVLHRLLDRGLAVARDIAPGVAAIAIIVICSYAVAVNQARIGQVGPWVLLLVVAVNALGYGLGWLLGWVYRFDRRHRLTLAIEIGMQNAGLGVALALKHFPPETALPGALFAVWCILTAAGASTFLRRFSAAR
jgi:BASS family bile acid:Na+ symporter